MIGWHVNRCRSSLEMVHLCASLEPLFCSIPAVSPSTSVDESLSSSAKYVLNIYVEIITARFGRFFLRLCAVLQIYLQHCFISLSLLCELWRLTAIGDVEIYISDSFYMQEQLLL